MNIDLRTLDDPSGTYKLEKSDGKTIYVRMCEHPDCETTWVHVDNVGNIKAFVAKNRHKNEQSSGWFVPDVVSVSFHPNMTLKGVPAINTD